MFTGVVNGSTFQIVKRPEGITCLRDRALSMVAAKLTACLARTYCGLSLNAIVTVHLRFHAEILRETYDFCSDFEIEIVVSRIL